jgi:hypothetical protein
MDPSLGPYIHCKLEQLPGHPGIDMHLRVQERRIEGSYDTAAGGRDRIVGPRYEELTY